MDHKGLVLDLYGSIDGMELHVSEHPRQAIATFMLKGEIHRLLLQNPLPLPPLMEFLDDCWCIQITDLNVAESNQLEFGRYRLGIGGEDGPDVEVLIDSFEHSVGA